MLTITPQATDQTFVEKLHRELSGHKDFVKGTDKRLWAVQFGIRHYAGTVTYSVKNFLEKNKDVQQELFFDYLEASSCEFIKNITKYRVCDGHTPDHTPYCTYCAGLADDVFGECQEQGHQVQRTHHRNQNQQRKTNGRGHLQDTAPGLSGRAGLHHPMVRHMYMHTHAQEHTYTAGLYLEGAVGLPRKN